MVKNFLLTTFLSFLVGSALAIDDPVDWSFDYQEKEAGVYEVEFEAEIDEGWYVYSNDIEPGGPIPTNIVFDDETGVQRGEILEEGDKEVEFEEVFDMELGFYYDRVSIKEEVEISEAGEFAGFLEYMACDGDQCTPPLEFEFAFTATSEVSAEKEQEAEEGETSGWEVESDEKESAEKEADGDPVSWSFDIEQTGDHQVTAHFKADIEDGWYIYAPDIPEGGPIPFSVFLDAEGSFVPETDIKSEEDPSERFDEIFEMDIRYFEGETNLSQEFQLTESVDHLEGFVEYMACDDEQCTPPLESEFSLDIPEEVTPAEIDEVAEGEADDQTITAGATGTENTDTLLMVFLGGLLGGLIALLTPCVFPMIMLTVSFFTNRQGGQAKGMMDAGFYGFSIVLIYVLFGFFITLLLGPNTIQTIASSPWVNLGFFLVFAIFAMSFFGAFEIKLPNSWANKFDQHSGRGGFIGVFFMALTLVVVSFSCTGPILGTLLIEAAVGGGQLGPLIGITGFAIAFAVPYVLFAVFPSLLQKLPQSGGWMNTVKVVLGFLILALAMRFLSIAARVAHWEILTREVFIVVWIVLFAMLGFYLLGKIRFAHDTEVNYVSVPRLFMAIVSFGFAIYLVPGMWGAPLNLAGAWLPPQTNQEFTIVDMGSGGDAEDSEYQAVMADRNYSDMLSCSGNITCFFDYHEAREYASENDKPLLVDFTGHSCANCDLMHSQVWSEPAVQQKLDEEFVVVQLYVDDRSDIPDDDYRYLGQKWQELQREKFQTISLPYYALIDADENLLAEPRGYDTDVEAYLEWMETGLKNFQNGNKLQTLR